MSENIVRNMYSSQGIKNYPTQLHLVGHFCILPLLRICQSFNQFRNAPSLWNQEVQNRFQKSQQIDTFMCHTNRTMFSSRVFIHILILYSRLRHFLPNCFLTAIFRIKYFIRFHLSVRTTFMLPLTSNNKARSNSIANLGNVTGKIRSVIQGIFSLTL